MINIRKLVRPNKRSGYKLGPGEKMEVRGVTIYNYNQFTIWVDKFTPYHQLKKNKKVKRVLPKKAS